MRTTRFPWLTAGAYALALAACSDPTPDPPAQYITARRHWNPGERDAVIASVKASNAWIFPGVGNLSPYADKILADTESVTVMVPNPAFSVSASGISGFAADVRANLQWNLGWNIYGTDVWEINNTQAPPDTVRWLGVFWWNPAESGWKGWAIAASKNATVAQTRVDTVVFNASFSRVGASAGEVRAADGTEWVATGVGILPQNTITVTSAAYGAPSTITTGPALGGTQAFGTMTGRLRNIPIQRISGPTGPAAQTVDLDFSGGLNAVQFICKYKVPCTTNTP